MLTGVWKSLAALAPLRKNAPHSAFKVDRLVMSWPPPRNQLPRAEARPTARRGRVFLPLVGLLLLGGYLFVSLSLKSRVLESEPGAAH